MAQSYSTLHYVDPQTTQTLTPPTDFSKTSYAVFNPETGVASVHLVGRAGEDTVSDYLLNGPCEAFLTIPEGKLDEAVTELLNVSLKELAENTNEMVPGACFTGNLHVNNRIYNANVGDCCGFTASLNEKAFAFFSSKGRKVNVRQLSTAVFNHQHINCSDEKLLTDIEKIEKERIQGIVRTTEFTRSFGDKHYTYRLIREPAIGVCINDSDKCILAFNASDGIAEILKLEEMGNCIQSFMESKSLKSFDQLDNAKLLELAIHIANNAKTVWSVKSFHPRDDMSITMVVHNPKKPKFIFYNTNDGHGGTEVAEYIRKNFNNILSKHVVQVAKKYLSIDEQKIHVPAIAATLQQENEQDNLEKTKLVLSLPEKDSATFHSGSSLQAYSILATSTTVDEQTTNIPAIATAPQRENKENSQEKIKLALSLPEEDSTTFDAGSSLQAYSILASSPTNANKSSEKSVSNSNSGCCCTIV